MIYSDGFPMDENLRLEVCPKCGNEEFGDDAEYCRICGTYLYNMCDGQEIYDYDGIFDRIEKHRNHGNARYCEKCGKPTAFFNAKLLRPYNEVKPDFVQQYLYRNADARSEKSNSADYDDNDFSF